MNESPPLILSAIKHLSVSLWKPG